MTDIQLVLCKAYTLADKLGHSDIANMADLEWRYYADDYEKKLSVTELSNGCTTIMRNLHTFAKVGW